MYTKVANGPEIQVNEPRRGHAAIPNIRHELARKAGDRSLFEVSYASIPNGRGAVWILGFVELRNFEITRAKTVEATAIARASAGATPGAIAGAGAGAGAATANAGARTSAARSAATCVGAASVGTTCIGTTRVCAACVGAAGVTAAGIATTTRVCAACVAARVGAACVAPGIATCVGAARVVTRVGGWRRVWRGASRNTSHMAIYRANRATTWGRWGTIGIGFGRALCAGPCVRRICIDRDQPRSVSNVFDIYIALPTAARVCARSVAVSGRRIGNAADNRR
ncbi:hypothetical protein DBV10_02105 [Acidovorax sp. FJL06]|nr:hypothetical protein DBV10_02105 [Acidovorax sp. FJL06]